MSSIVDEELGSRIADRLRERRVELGLSLGDLARRSPAVAYRQQVVGVRGRLRTTLGASTFEVAHAGCHHPAVRGPHAGPPARVARHARLAALAERLMVVASVSGHHRGAMARMHPTTLLEAQVESAAEVRVFDLLEGGLGDDWSVFHAVSWVRRDRAEGARDGEIDFVLAHPRHGIVVLEVKGGDLDCRFGAWSRRVDGVAERMEDPFRQALDHRYDLQRLVRRQDWLVVQCVAFPDVSVPKLQLAPHAPRELVLDRHDVEDPAAALARVLAYHRGGQDERTGPGERGVERLRELLAPTVELRVPLAHVFGAEERELVRLTEEQALALEGLRRAPRVAVSGCAGSGKTLLAVAHARRLADAGQDVLFTCFNRALAQHLERTAGHERITFRSLHALLRDEVGRAGVPLAWPSKDDAEGVRRFWDEDVPTAYVEAVATLGPRWDALVVDEAQDLHGAWFDALRLGLREEDAAPVWLFLDDNQRVYDRTFEVPADFARYDLPANCRTTRAIHRELVKLHRGDVTPAVRGPEGRPPELVHTSDPAGTVEEVIDRLLDHHDVPADQVVVLSSHGRDSHVRRRLRGRFVDDRTRARGRRVLFSSIRAFKGLESAVVVLCELEGLDRATWDAQLYVGMSRARNHCVVVAPPAA